MFSRSKNNYQERNVTPGLLIPVFGVIARHQNRCRQRFPRSCCTVVMASDLKYVNITAMTTFVRLYEVLALPLASIQAPHRTTSSFLSKEVKPGAVQIKLY